MTIHLGLAASVIIAAFLLGGKMRDFQAEQESTNKNLQAMTLVLTQLSKQAANDRWSYSMMIDWSTELFAALEKAGVDVDRPDVREIRERHISEITQ